MKEQVTINKKWMEAYSATFTEEKDENGNRELYLTTRIVPFNEISRNGVRYNTESVKKTHKLLEGKTLNHNHITTGANVLPRGKWIETWIKEGDGMWGKAKVFDTKYNEDYIEWLQADESPRVSLQISGSAKQFKEENTGKWRREAIITDWLESSTVNLPGFDNASGSFAVAMAEAFEEENYEEDNMTDNEKEFFEKLNSIKEKYNLSDYSKRNYRECATEIIKQAEKAVNMTNDEEVYDDFKLILDTANNIKKKLGENKRPKQTTVSVQDKPEISSNTTY